MFNPQKGKDYAHLLSLLSFIEDNLTDAVAVFVPEENCFLLTDKAQRLLGVRQEICETLPGETGAMMHALAATCLNGDASSHLVHQKSWSDEYTVSAELREHDHSSLVLFRFTGFDSAVATDAYKAQLLDHIQNSIIAVDEKGSITHWNSGAERLFNRRAKDMIGHSIDLLGTGYKPEAMVEAFQKSGLSINGEWSFEDVDGQSRHIAIELSALQNAKGEITGAVGVSHDLTEEHKLRLEIERQRELFNTVFENTRVGLAVLDTEGHVRAANMKTYAILEALTPADQNVKMSVDTFRQCGLLDKIDTKGSEQLIDQCTLKTAQGEVRHYRVHYSPMQGAAKAADEDIQLYILGVDDITSNVESKAHIDHLMDQLVMSDLRSRTLLEEGRDIIAVFDEDGQVEDITESVSTVLHLNLEEAFSKPIWKVLDMGENDLKTVISDLRADGDQAQFYAPIHCKDGERWFHLIFVNRLNTLAVGGIVVTAREVTIERNYHLRKQAFLQRLEVEKRAMEELHRLKSAFLANMSHEIRTPLNGVIGLANLIKEEAGRGNLADYADIQIDSSHRLLSTVNSILEMARLESAQVQNMSGSCNISVLTMKVVELFRPQAVRKSIQLGAVVPRQEFRVAAPEGVVNIVLNNLVGNALKFTERGSVEIKLFEEPFRNRVVLEVIDTGVGMEPDFLQRIFKPFEQESTGTSRRFEGSGLGLAITKQYTEMAGGSISVETEKGKGSTFAVAFPLITSEE